MKIPNLALTLFRLTCRDASPLISEMMDHPLTPSKWIRVKFHLAICEFCRYYKKQLEALGVLASNLGREDSPATGDISMTPEAKQRIKKMLESRN